MVADGEDQPRHDVTSERGIESLLDGLVGDARRDRAELITWLLDRGFTVDQIAARLKEHLDAGADHVPVQVLTKDENLVSALAELAGPLELNRT